MTRGRRHQGSGRVNPYRDHADLVLCRVCDKAVEVLLAATESRPNAARIEDVEIRLGGLISRLGCKLFDGAVFPYRGEARVLCQTIVHGSPQAFGDLVGGEVQRDAGAARVVIGTDCVVQMDELDSLQAQTL